MGRLAFKIRLFLALLPLALSSYSAMLYSAPLKNCVGETIFSEVNLQSFIDQYTRQKLGSHYKIPTATELVAIKAQSARVSLKEEPGLKVIPRYHDLGMPGTSAVPEARLALATRLITIARKLPPGYSLVIFDVFRTQKAQLALFQKSESEIARANPTWTPEQVTQETLKYVAHPGKYAEYRVSPHNSGGAVDLSMSYQGKELDFGNAFDTLSEQSATAYFERKWDPAHDQGFSEERWNKIRENRRLLAHLMFEQGFTNYPDEWWHFDIGNVLWRQALNAVRPESGQTPPAIGEEWEFGSMEDLGANADQNRK